MSKPVQESLDYPSKLSRQPAHIQRLMADGTAQAGSDYTAASGTLTFNPGWDNRKATLPEFEDVRELQKAFKARGLTPNPAADESTTGPAFFMLTDPDGNPILFDQHVPSPHAANPPHPKN